MTLRVVFKDGTVWNRKYEDIVNWEQVDSVNYTPVDVWLRHTRAAATDAAHPAAESPREVSDGQPDDAPTLPQASHSDARPKDAHEAFSRQIDNCIAGGTSFVKVTLPVIDEVIPGYDELGGDDTGKVADPFIGVQETLNARGARYGDFTDNAAISQDIKRAMSGCKGWSLLTDVQREALTVIAQKIARILNGDPNYRDNWHDIQGYARLAEERCRD